MWWNREIKIRKQNLSMLFFCYFSAEKMRFWRISWSTDEIEQYDKQSSLTFLCFGGGGCCCFFSATFLQNNTQILWTVRSADEIEKLGKLNKSKRYSLKPLSDCHNITGDMQQYMANWTRHKSARIATTLLRHLYNLVRYSMTFIRLCTS